LLGLTIAIPASAQASTTARYLGPPWIQGLVSNGPGVVCVQTALNKYTGHTEVAIDGQYGPVTTRAVVALQTWFGMPQSGIVNNATGEIIKRLYGNHGAGGVWAWACQNNVPAQT
jgi:peptidoglycan hydrolase-like protein with peptidoglycan-binding domain